jgi:hypothetical protein
MIWAPSLHLYFPIGALAAYKALWEAFRRPFFWDKTCHGVLDDGLDSAEAEPEPAAKPAPLRLENPIFPARARKLPAPVPVAAPVPAPTSVPVAAVPVASQTAAAHDAKNLRWSYPAPRLIVTPQSNAPEKCHQLGRRLASAAPGIEFQARFEGF